MEGVRPQVADGTAVVTRARIGERLRQAGVVTAAGLQDALEEQKRHGGRLGSVLVRLKLANDRQVAEALAAQLELPFVDLSRHPLSPEALDRIPKRTALVHSCIPIAIENKELTVAMSDPLLFAAIQDLEFQTSCRVRQVVATPDDIRDAIRRGYPDAGMVHVGAAQSSTATAASVEADSESSPVVEIVDLAIRSALRNGASDVHIEPSESGVVVRQRVDGLLKEVMDLPKWVHEGVVARIKVMAGLDIAEKRLPQDGRIRTNTDTGHRIDLRVSTLRTIAGEKVVLRVLDHRKGVPPLETLGLSPEGLRQVQGFLSHQHGMILVVGPTGSGKTTTLSSALAAVRSERTNIVTIEDPVEYQLSGINQTQTNSKIDLTFARSLRAVLRQDPDVVLVGEIRDHDTARVAMQAAQTGHLVLSTLHTNDAPSSVERLADLGIEPYVSASALVGIIAQRLVRRLCMICRLPYVPDAEMLRALAIADHEAEGITVYRPAGCDHCHHTGYRGRIGIYEIMSVTEEVRRLISGRAAVMALRSAARAGGMRTLAEDGVFKVRAGLTSPEELRRVVTTAQDADGRCLECGGGMEAEYVVCPTCGHPRRDECSQCRRPLNPDWKFCPYCAASIVAEVRQEPGSLTRLRAVG
jgi:type IV pilus assembly protein PilB